MIDIPKADAGAGASARQRRQGSRLWSAAKAFAARYRRLDLLVAVMLVLGAGVLRTIDPTWLEIQRVRIFDQFQAWQPRVATNYPVVIVDIDERSLAELGQWPWPRTLLAELVDKLAAAGALAIGFDIVFPEADRMSPGNIAEHLTDVDSLVVSRLKEMPSNDRIFADAFRRARVVLGQVGQHGPPSDADRPPPKRTTIAQIGGDPRRFLQRQNRFLSLIRNIDVLERAAAGRGMIQPALEADAVVRRVPAITQVGDDLYPALAIELLRVATKQSAIAVKSTPQGISGVVVAGVQIPSDEAGRVWVHYAPTADARYVSAADVLTGSVGRARLQNRLVLVGTSAAGLLDLRATPVSGIIPGVEVHAQLIENIVTRSHLLRPSDATGMEIAMTLAASALIIFLVPLVGPTLTIVALFVAVGGTALTSWYLFANEKLLLDFSFPAIAAFLSYTLLAVSSYRRTTKQREQVRGAFSRYLSPTLVERLAEDPGQLHLGGENRYMTLMFADVHRFTSISEQYDAPSLTRLINRLFTPITDAILSHGGTVDKYIGDCVMAFWNAPLDDPEHGRHACLAALEMQRRLKILNNEIKREAQESGATYTVIHLGTGLNTGDCMVGNMGSEQRFDYSVLGDTVNIASRLEGQTRYYKVAIIIGESVREQVPELATLELDLIRVIGKSVPERIFTVVGDETVRAADAFQRLKSFHDEMLAAYRAQDWEAATAALQRCMELADEFGVIGYYEMLERRITSFKATGVPADWDGVHDAEGK